jgi:hypothetical protein
MYQLLISWLKLWNYPPIYINKNSVPAILPVRLVQDQMRHWGNIRPAFEAISVNK